MLPLKDDRSKNTLNEKRRTDLEIKLSHEDRERMRGHQLSRAKLRVGAWILGVCGFLLLLFYGGEIFIALREINMEPQIRIMVIEPVRFVLTATVGYVFGIRAISEKRQ